MKHIRLFALAALVASAAACGGTATTDAESPAPAPPSPSAAPASPPAAPPATSTTTAPAAVYVFPVQPAADAEYARAHHDYPAADMFAPCGTAVVATTDGVVDEVNTVDAWDPAVDDGGTRSGLLISIVGDDGVRYYGSHLQSIEDGIEAGSHVEAGDSLGTVGNTGNARGIACHMHFGISPPTQPGDWEIEHGVVWPWPYLDAWKAGDAESPTDEIATWAEANLG